MNYTEIPELMTVECSRFLVISVCMSDQIEILCFKRKLLKTTQLPSPTANSVIWAKTNTTLKTARYQANKVILGRLERC